MAHDKRSKKAAAAPDQEDRISALPDGILQHVLGFLPADEAVRTSVLARHWRHQWRSMRRLRIDCDKAWCNEDNFVKFVNRLLLLRAPGMTLDDLEVSSNLSIDPEVEEEIHIWIRHALMCKVRALIIELSITLDTPLISQHLRRLEIAYVEFGADCLDFATCPTLEVLYIREVSCSRILSRSVKHLRIRYSRFTSDIRACISMPSLISLQLNKFLGKAPLLEFMPSLQTAFVKPAGCWEDTCMKKSDYGCDCCAYCCGQDDHRGRSVLLGSLSNAMHLELTAYGGTDGDCKAESEGRNHHQMERVPKLSECLKLVEIKCKNVDSRVCEIISFLSRFMQVNLMLVTRKSHLFSFEN